jgi:hypothetical protein
LFSRIPKKYCVRPVLIEGGKDAESAEFGRYTADGVTG